LSKVINDSAVVPAVTAAVVRASASFKLAGEAIFYSDGVALARQLRPDLLLFRRDCLPRLSSVFFA